MKKRLLFSLVAGMFVLAVNAQNTPSIIKKVELQNADFSQGDPVTTTIYTYDYNMPDNGAGGGDESLFGMQPVEGWTANYPSDNIKVMNASGDPAREDDANAKAAGIFAYLTGGNEDSNAGLGGDYLPPYDSDSPDRTGNNVLGMVTVWSSDFKYAQEVSLPAGDYMLIVKVWNTSGTDTFAKNNMGFIAADKSYVSSKTTYPTQTWTNDTIFFQLKEATNGQISLGYAAGNYGSGSAPHLFIDAVELYQIDPSYLIQVEIDKAKEKLLAAIEEGEMYGADTAPALAVYNNPNATLAEVEAATEAQKERNQGSLTDLSEYFIQNPKFSEDEATDSEIYTYAKDMDGQTGNSGTGGWGVAEGGTSRYGTQPISGWNALNETDNIWRSGTGGATNGHASGVYAIGSSFFLGGKEYLPPTSLSDGSEEGKVLGMVTCWTGTVQYTQNVVLPAGQYSITMSYYNSGGANDVEKNLIGFITNDGKEYLGETKGFPVKAWKTDVVKFTLEQETTGYFSLGYKATNTGSGNMPHLFVDGFSLIYVGTGINASLMGLTSQVNGGKKLLEEQFNVDLKSQFTSVLNDGEALVDAKSEDTDANKAATNAIKNMLADVNASIQAYKDLNAFRTDELIPATDKYTADSYAALSAQLSTMLDEVTTALTASNWTTAQINDTIASLPTIIKEGVQKAWDAAIASGEKLEKDLDITPLFKLDYTYSTTVQQGSNVPDKEWSYGDASNFKTQYGTAEVWNQSPFAVSQTLTGLPAGKYTITTKAFFRNAANAANYENYDDGNTPEASVFAGFSKTGLTNVAVLAKESDEAIDGWATLEEGGTTYVPNSQKAAYDIFNDKDYTALVQKSVSSVVSGKGELTFGVTADVMEDNCWVVWYGFELAYNAMEANDMADALEGMRKQADEILDGNENVQKVETAVEKLNTAKDEHDAVDKTDLAAMSEVMALYEEAFAYAEEADSLAEVLYNTTLIYTYLSEEYGESDEPGYTQILSDADVAVNDKVANNERMQELIDDLKNKWAYYVAYPAINTADAENPVDITAAIYNNSFTDPEYLANDAYDLDDEATAKAANNANGWTIEREGGKNEGQGAGAFSDDQHHVYEFYDTKTFSISQTLNGLPAGNYVIEVQGFNRGANSPKELADTLALDPNFGKDVYLFAQAGEADSITVLKNMFQREDSEGELDPGMVDDASNEIAVAFEDYEEFYVPSGQKGFNLYAECDLYWNKVSITLLEGQALTFGLRKDNAEGYVSGNWVVFDNFKLYYLGNGEEENAINGIKADVEKQQAIYNVAGQRVQKAIKGLYIVNGNKVIVK